MYKTLIKTSNNEPLKRASGWCELVKSNYERTFESA